MIDIWSFAGTRQHVRGFVEAVNDDWWHGLFSPGEGDILVAGETYSDAHEYGSMGPSPEMGMFGNGRSCLLTGSFTVNQLDFLADTTVDRLDLTFEQRCDGDTGALRGRIRYRARDDITPPAPVIGLTATRTTNTAAHLEWANPADGDYVDTVVRYLPGSQAPRHPTVGHLAYTGTGTSVDVSGLIADRAYTFGIFTYDATGNASRVRVISIPGSAQQTITAAPTTVTYGSAVSINGVLTDLDGVPLDAQTTRLQARAPGSATWATSSTLTTSGDGTAHASVTPSASREYRLVSDATPAYAASASTPVFATVRHKVTAALNDNSIGLGQTVTIRGSVAPNHRGRPVYLQRYYSGAWRTMKTATLSSTSAYSFSYKPGSTGTRTLRVYRPADTDHAAGASPTLKLTITT